MFGSASLEHDKLVRNLGLKRLAKEEFKKLPATMKDDLLAYCKGVNDYIEGSSGKMPIEFLLLGIQPRQWEPEDTLAILKYVQYEEDESWQLDDLRQRVMEKCGDKFASVLFEQNLKGTGVGSDSPSPSLPPSAVNPKLVSDAAAFFANDWTAAIISTDLGQ